MMRLLARTILTVIRAQAYSLSTKRMPPYLGPSINSNSIS